MFVLIQDPDLGISVPCLVVDQWRCLTTGRDWYIVLFNGTRRIYPKGD